MLEFQKAKDYQYLLQVTWENLLENKKDWLESGAITGILPCKAQWSSKLLSALVKLSTNVDKN